MPRRNMELIEKTGVNLGELRENSYGRQPRSSLRITTTQY